MKNPVLAPCSIVWVLFVAVLPLAGYAYFGERDYDPVGWEIAHKASLQSRHDRQQAAREREIFAAQEKFFGTLAWSEWGGANGLQLRVGTPREIRFDEPFTVGVQMRGVLAELVPGRSSLRLGTYPHVPGLQIEMANGAGESSVLWHALRQWTWWDEHPSVRGYCIIDPELVDVADLVTGEVHGFTMRFVLPAKEPSYSSHAVEQPSPIALGPKFVRVCVGPTRPMIERFRFPLERTYQATYPQSWSGEACSGVGVVAVVGG